MDVSEQLLKLKKIKENIALVMFNSKDKTFYDLKALNFVFNLMETILELLNKINNAIFMNERKMLPYSVDTRK